MPRVAGSSVLTLKVFLERTYGEGTYSRAVADLSGDHGAPFRSIILPVNWYDAPTYLRALHTASQHAADGEFFEKFGAFAADYQITAFRKFILRFTSPSFFLDHATRLWSRTHDTGSWVVEPGSKSMRGTLRDFAIVDPAYCRVLVAWIHRASQLTGTRGQTVHSQCRAAGGEACVFDGRWE